MSKPSSNAAPVRAQQPPLSVTDALEILAAALAECSKAGLSVTVGTVPASASDGPRAVIVLPGVSGAVQDGRAVFTMTEAQHEAQH